MKRNKIIIALLAAGLLGGVGRAAASQCPCPGDLPYAGQDACGNDVCDAADVDTYPYTDACGNGVCEEPPDDQECCGETQTYRTSEHCCDDDGNLISTTPGEACTPPSLAGQTSPPANLGINAVTGGANVEEIVSIQTGLFGDITIQVVEIQVTAGSVTNLMINYGTFQKVENCSNRSTGCGVGRNDTCTPSSIQVQSSKVISTALSLTAFIPHPGVNASVNLAGNLATNWGLNSPDPVAYGIDGEPFKNFYADVYTRVNTIGGGSISGTVNTRNRTDYRPAPSQHNPFPQVIKGNPGAYTANHLNQAVTVSGNGRESQSVVQTCSIPCCP